MTYLPYNETETQIDDFINSIKTYCILIEDEIQFVKNYDGKKGIMKFIIANNREFLYTSSKDEFNQESNKNTSSRFIFDLRVNRLYIRTKFRAKTEILIPVKNIFSVPIESIIYPQEIISEYDKLNIKPSLTYNKRKASSLTNTEHYYEHVFKIHKLDYEKLNKIISVFVKYKNRHR